MICFLFRPKNVPISVFIQPSGLVCLESFKVTKVLKLRDLSISHEADPMVCGAKILFYIFGKET